MRRLAGSSRDTSSGFEKSYVAKLEAGNIPVQVQKFLTYMRLVGASVDYLSECLETAVPVSPQVVELGVDELLSHVKECVRTGDHEQAMRWVFSALERFEPDDVSSEKVTLLRAGGIVAKHMSLWELAKRFAEDSLNVPGITRLERAKTLLLLAEVYSAMGQPESAKIHLQQIGEAELRANQKLRRGFHHNYGLVLLDSARPEDRQEAELSLRLALEEYEKSQENLPDHVCVLVVLSRASLEAGQLDQAKSYIEDALERADAANDERGWQRVLIAQGRVCAARLRMDEAYAHLSEAVKRSRRANNTTNCFEAQLELLAVCISLGRQSEAERLRATLRRQQHRVRLDAASMQKSRRLLGDGGATGGSV